VKGPLAELRLEGGSHRAARELKNSCPQNLVGERSQYDFVEDGVERPIVPYRPISTTQSNNLSPKTRKPRPWLWIPGPALARRPGMTTRWR
jgi:hypothetical protein